MGVGIGVCMVDSSCLGNLSLLLSCHTLFSMPHPQARNALESFIYETKDFLYTEEAVALTTEEERNALFEVLNQASDWMFEDGDTAETSVS